jgi:hypothetical protein
MTGSSLPLMRMHLAGGSMLPFWKHCLKMQQFMQKMAGACEYQCYDLRKIRNLCK